jgi:hypothetical protein
MGELFQLGLPERLCSQCEHAYLGADGVWCMAYRELIWQETVAGECELYEPTASTGSKGA